MRREDERGTACGMSRRGRTGPARTTLRDSRVAVQARLTQVRATRATRRRSSRGIPLIPLNPGKSRTKKCLLIHESPLTDALFLLVSKSDEVTTT